jgi:hypothetical protein
VQLGRLTFVPASDAAEPVRRYLGGDGLWVSEIDPSLADTAAPSNSAPKLYSGRAFLVLCLPEYRFGA